MDKPSGSEERRRLYVSYAAGSRKGRQAFRSGEVQTFPTDDERAESNFSLSLAFTPESEQTVRDICSRIDEIAKKHGIPLVLAGRDPDRDFRIHTTLQSGVLAGDAARRKETYGEIYFDPELLQQKEGLAGLTLNFKFVVTNNNSITLTAVDIPDEITKYRTRAKEVALEHGVSIPQYPDILHITLARLTTLPETGRAEKLKGFLDDMLALRREFSRDSIPLVVDHVFTAPVKRHTHLFTMPGQPEARPEILTIEKMKVLGDRMMEIGKSMVEMQATIRSKLKEDDSPVSAADLKAESEIIEEAERLFPRWPTVSEETNYEAVPGPTYKSIDGLDGTRWYVAGLPGWCLSIGFVRDGEPVGGIIVQPSSKQCFLALKGSGVFVREGSARKWNRFVRGRAERPMFGTDLDRTSAADPNDPYWTNVRSLIAKLGEYPFNSPSIPAALSVAQGNFWGWYTRNAKNWDVAASSVLIQELGGVVEQLNGDPLPWDSIKMPPFLIAESPDQAKRIRDALAAS